jgi:hypothetical protein
MDALARCDEDAAVSAAARIPPARSSRRAARLRGAAIYERLVPAGKEARINNVLSLYR